MKRLFTAAAVAATIAAIPSPVAAAANCAFNAAEHKVIVTISGSTHPYLYPSPVGAITMNGYNCGAATLTNTDTIVVTGDSAAQNLNITLANGPFRPGFTNESGTSDEIEFQVNLFGGEDTLVIIGNDNVNKLDFGQDNSQFVPLRKVNLNAGETKGVDADITFTNVEKVTVWGLGNNDVIRARGKQGTGPNALSLPMLVYAGPGADIVKAGEAGDRIYGHDGKDKVWGFGGGDFIHLDDGKPGDEGYGGATNDLAYIDAGDIWVDQ